MHLGCEAGHVFLQKTEVLASLTVSQLQDLESKTAAAARAKQQADAKKVLQMAPSKRLAIALLKKGWQIGAPQISVGSHTLLSIVKKRIEQLRESPSAFPAIELAGLMHRCQVAFPSDVMVGGWRKRFKSSIHSTRVQGGA